LLHRGKRANSFETPLGRIGVMICWDMVHTLPEELI
jgi:predicted amidohydrolase